MFKTKIRNYILFGSIGVLALTSVFMTVETATTGVEISRLEKVEEGLTRQKMDLEESLVKTMSLAELQEKSLNLGFTKADSLVYITPSESVAKLP